MRACVTPGKRSLRTGPRGFEPGTTCRTRSRRRASSSWFPRPGGRFCVAVLHPIAAAGSWDEEATAFVVDQPYSEAGPWRKTAERENGASFTFEDVRRPLEGYTLALERAGLELEAVREPVPDA